ncbi:MAG: hypothetical protein NZ529_06215, partial [Cytophagaceae bacterium]|nr:hypothetical protein [Cytophagaceae bacterium]MDW8456373.1 hypothetical protein [Cytophagaceae bacterium]
GQCGALVEHRSDSGVADSPAPQGRALYEKHFTTAFCQCVIWIYSQCCTDKKKQGGFTIRNYLCTRRFNANTEITLSDNSTIVNSS